MSGNVFGGLFLQAKARKARPREEAAEGAAVPPRKKQRKPAKDEGAPRKEAAKAQGKKGASKRAPRTKSKEVESPKKPEVLVEEGEDPRIADEAASLWKQLLSGKMPADDVIFDEKADGEGTAAVTTEADEKGEEQDEKQEKAEEDEDPDVTVAGVDVAPPPIDDDRKVFVGGITAKKKQIIAIFSEFGAVQDVLVPQPKGSGQKPTSAFVEFATPSEAKKALEMDGKEVNGEVIRVKPVHSKVPRRNRDKSTTLFVRNLAFDVTRQALTELFLDCGKIKRVTIPSHKDTHKPKGTAFVEFAKPDSVDRALRKNRTCLNGRQILLEVAKKGQGSSEDTLGAFPSAAVHKKFT